ncbi:MAG: radical SAM protein [Acidobacteria bacterium]|nr:MAG: radical SAM protein [Acidobacteriota bacterium]
MRFVHPLVALARALVAAPRLLSVRPSLNAFLAGYFRKFPVSEVGGRLILHSHLPPIDSPAYARFVRLHLVERRQAPSHAQVAVTAACPQRCLVCYNRDRQGVALDPLELRRVVSGLVESGVVWLGLTGGEPLLRPDLPDLVALARGRCAVKLFTTGMGVTKELARSLRNAGLFSVSVSIDHWDAVIHDRGRGFPGAWRHAVEAVKDFLEAGGLHVGISAVLPREMICRTDVIERVLAFAQELGVDELWLSEAKPAVASLFDEKLVLAEDERRAIADWQDRWNDRVRRAGRGVILNYLGHFEGAEHFGCNAGRKMIYVDPFGEVSPCVFTPFSLGNVRERPLADLVADMWRRFPTEGRCFMNRNWPLVAAASGGRLPLTRDASLAMLSKVRFGPPSAFNRRYFGT